MYPSWGQKKLTSYVALYVFPTLMNEINEMKMRTPTITETTEQFHRTIHCIILVFILVFLFLYCIILVFYFYIVIISE